MDSSPVNNDKSLSIAVVSSSTITGIREGLSRQCAEQGLQTQLYIGEYNQYAQEIFDSHSELYQAKPNLIVIWVDTMAIMGSSFFLPYTLSTEERISWVNETTSVLCGLALQCCKNSKAKVILHNLEIPLYSPLGLDESKETYGSIESIEDINRGLRDRFRRNSQVYIFDYNAFCSKIGKENILDHKMYYMGDIKLKPKYFSVLCQEYMSYIRPLASITKKCIVLDLDNTLWGGIVGECGVDGIQLGPTTEGRPFLEFQQLLLALFGRGIILAINSRNNIGDALLAIKEHPYMILREKHFAAMRINWDDKVANMQSLAEELNLGLGSFVFFDDDSMNCDMVRQFIPEVLVVELPKDPSLYVRTLMNLTCFGGLGLTEEDKQKGRMYSEEKSRRKLQQSATDLTEYLRMLNISITFREVERSTVTRVSQLTQKTNQFNVTTRRYTEEDIADFAGSDRYRIISLQLTDKFGDSGLTGVAIVEIVDQVCWRIDSFLLSCRILGKSAEEALLTYIINEAKKGGARTLHGEFVFSRQNKPAEKLYQNCGFKRLETDGALEIWECDLNGEYSYPDNIHVIEKP